MDEEPTADQPRYLLRNRPTTVSSSFSQVPITSHANLPAIDGCMTEGRSSGEAVEASLVDPPLRDMPQLSPMLEVEQQSQDMSSTEIFYAAFTAAGHNQSAFTRCNRHTDIQRASKPTFHRSSSSRQRLHWRIRTLHQTPKPTHHKPADTYSKCIFKRSPQCLFFIRRTTKPRHELN